MSVNKLYRHDVEIWSYEDHWGEIKSLQKHCLSAELVQSIIEGAVKQENPKECVFSLEEEEEDNVKATFDLCPENEVIRHTIRLNFYCKRLQRLIRMLAAKKTEFRGPPHSEVCKIPQMVIHRDLGKTVLRDRRGSSGGRWIGSPSLDKDIAHRMLEKAVIGILAHSGYEKTRKVALDTLVDVIKELIAKISMFCHTFAQKDLNRGQVSYDDVLEKSLRTVGFDGIQSIKDYYKKKILLKRDRAFTKATRLLSMYEKLLNNYGLNNMMVNSIPELHFPATSGRQSSEALNAILKPGFRMLQTLDRETQQGSESSQSQQ